MPTLQYILGTIGRLLFWSIGDRTVGSDLLAISFGSNQTVEGDEWLVVEIAAK